MATAVSHAMRRYHSSSSDHKYSHYSSIRGEDPSLVPWPSRADASTAAGPVASGALSRSMRYAEPWLYGSVRGAPVLLAAAYPQPAHALLQLCVCADYVQGTARTLNKNGKPATAQLCKKCKGTRLPVVGHAGTVRSKYGTVRGYPTASPQPALTPMRAGTARVSTPSSRPTILPSAPPIDPYDLMRRSRLSCTAEIGSQFRTRSTSPSKSRGLDIRPYSSPRPKTRPRSPSPSKPNHPGRKSILECDVNPYELMSGDNNDTRLGLDVDRKGKLKNLDKDYEDIDAGVVKKNTSHIPKLQNKSRKTSNTKKANNDYPTIRNEAKFKSILKKPTVGLTKMEIGSDLPNGTISSKSGTHFYLPLPTFSPPRKKVQFLVENELLQNEKDYEEMFKDKYIGKEAAKDVKNEENEPQETKQSQANEVLGNDDIDEDLNTEPCRLKRSFSERLSQIHTSISFNDTMALRPSKARNIISESGASTLFDAVTDLQRLDGIGPTRPRPKEPPPPPPPPSHTQQEAVEKLERAGTPPPRSTTEMTTGYEVTMVDDALGVYEDVAEETEMIEQRYGKVVEEKEDVEDGNGLAKVLLGLNGLLLNNNNNTKLINIQVEKSDIALVEDNKADKNETVEFGNNLSQKDASNKQNLQNSSNKLLKKKESKSGTNIQNNSKQSGNSSSNFTPLSKDVQSNTNNNYSEESKKIQTPPSAPPRKRSNSKQPITSQILAKKEAETEKLLKDQQHELLENLENNKSSSSDNKFIAIEKEDTDKLEEIRKKKETEMEEKLQKIIMNENPTSDNHPEEQNVEVRKCNDMIQTSEPITAKVTIRTSSDSTSSSGKTAKRESLDLNVPYQKMKTEPSKTIVQINSPTIQVIPSTVHRLQIKNEFPETTNYNKISITESPQRKTSIMINGDDCYSTVNVNDDVPIYQSSVVVNDYDPNKIEINFNNRSSSVYITGDFQSKPTNLTSPSDKSEERPKKTLVILEGAHSSSSSTPLIAVSAQSTPEITAKTFVVLQNESDETNDESGHLQSHAKNIITEVEKEETEKIIEDDLEVKRSGKEETEKQRKQTDVTEEEEEEAKPSSEELQRLLKDPVEAVKRNLIPHVCGKADMDRKPKSKKSITSNSLVARLLEDPFLGTLTEGLETNTVAKLIEDSLNKLRTQEYQDDDKDCSENESCPPYELMEAGSDCYSNHSNRSSVTEDELGTRSKFYQLLADAALSEVEEHHYECIRPNVDPIYEEIEIPPPLPVNPPPSSIVDDLQIDKQFTTRSIFEGASKYDILSYLVDAKERGIVPEENYTYNFNNSGEVIVEEEEETKEVVSVFSSRVSHMSTVSDSSEDSSLVITAEKNGPQKSAEVERNDSGVGSETSKCSRSRYLNQPETTTACEDCDLPIDPQPEDAPLICRKCSKKRSERKEIITEIVETEEKYSRDLQIILEEFYQPMLVAGLLTPEQLAAIFLNVEELLENSQALAERLRDTLEIAVEQGDEDLLTVNIGKIFLEAAPMLHAFESYCVRQGPASLLLASLEKDKELLRIFLRVSQMENTVLRRMNLNSFLMVPVQRVTKYPLLLARLHKVTPLHHESRELLRESQHKIELHLNHMNSETKDVPSRLWRRISSGSGRRSSSEMDLVNIKLRKIAVDVLEWNHDEARFALEGRLLYTQPTDNNWRKGRTIKLTPINALLVTNGKPNSTTKPDRSPTMEEGVLTFPRHTGVREAALLLVRDKGGRYSLLREPLYLDRCVIATDPAWQSYFEVQELLGKDTFIFKAEEAEMTRTWYRQLQYHAQGMGAWRKRRNALANIMINGMGSRS